MTPCGPAERGMTPTAIGGELLAPLRYALDQIRATVVRHGHFAPARACLTVTISCTDYLQAALVQPLVLQVRQQAPGVRVALRNLDMRRLEAQMAAVISTSRSCRQAMRRRASAAADY